MRISEFLSMSRCCIFVLINESKKLFQVYYTTQIANALLTNVYKFQNGSHDIKIETDLEFDILETFNKENELLMKYRMHEHIKNYLVEGYSLYKPVMPLDWKLEVVVERIDNQMGYRAIVKLRTSPRLSYRVKVFEKYEDAMEYVERTKIEEASLLV